MEERLTFLPYFFLFFRTFALRCHSEPSRFHIKPGRWRLTCRHKASHCISAHLTSMCHPANYRMGFTSLCLVSLGPTAICEGHAQSGWQNGGLFFSLLWDRKKRGKFSRLPMVKNQPLLPWSVMHEVVFHLFTTKVYFRYNFIWTTGPPRAMRLNWTLQEVKSQAAQPAECARRQTKTCCVAIHQHWTNGSSTRTALSKTAPVLIQRVQRLEPHSSSAFNELQVRLYVWAGDKYSVCKLCSLLFLLLLKMQTTLKSVPPWISPSQSSLFMPRMKYASDSVALFPSVLQHVGNYFIIGNIFFFYSFCCWPSTKYFKIHAIILLPVVLLDSLTRRPGILNGSSRSHTIRN